MKPIALYNCDKKELIGIFTELIIIAKYIRPTDVQKAYQSLFYALNNNGRIRKTIFDFNVTVRYANEKQAKELGDNKFIINDGYPKMSNNKSQGFISNKYEYYKQIVDSSNKQ